MKVKTFKFVVDGVTQENLTRLKKALAVVPTITGLSFNGATSVLSVEAASNPEDSIRLACEVAGARLRTHVK